MEELYKRADRYSTLEDNICAATQIVMIISKPTESNKSMRKKSFESKEGQSKNRKQSRDQSQKKREPQQCNPPEHLIREAAIPPSRLARFEVACIDLNRSLSEKPISAMR